MASSPVQRGDRQRGYGAPKRKLRWPLLPWGRKLPTTTVTTRAGGLEREDVLSCTGSLPSTKEWVGVSSGAAQLAGRQLVPSPGSVRASQVAAHPREGGQGPTSGIWPFPMQEAPSSTPRDGDTSCQVLPEPGFGS